MAKAKVTSLLNKDVMTITGGWLRKHEAALVDEWEVQVLQSLYGEKVFVAEIIKEEKPTKKTKK